MRIWKESFAFRMKKNSIRAWETLSWNTIKLNRKSKVSGPI